MEHYYSINIIDWGEKDFEEFIEDNSSLFYAFAYRYLKDKQDIKDLLQECYIKMWSNKKQISALESPLNYIFTMIKNRALNHIRDNKKSFVGLESIRDLNSKEDFDKTIFEAECSKAIVDAIRELSPQSREVINKIIEGHTMEEVANELKISINTVKTIKYRAVEKLTKTLPPRLLGIAIMISCFD